MPWHAGLTTTGGHIQLPQVEANTTIVELVAVSKYSSKVLRSPTNLLCEAIVVDVNLPDGTVPECGEDATLRGPEIETIDGHAASRDLTKRLVGVAAPDEDRAVFGTADDVARVEDDVEYTFFVAHQRDEPDRENLQRLLDLPDADLGVRGPGDHQRFIEIDLEAKYGSLVGLFDLHVWIKRLRSIVTDVPKLDLSVTSAGDQLVADNGGAINAVIVPRKDVGAAWLAGVPARFECLALEEDLTPVRHGQGPYRPARLLQVRCTPSSVAVAELIELSTDESDSG